MTRAEFAAAVEVAKTHQWRLVAASRADVTEHTAQGKLAGDRVFEDVLLYSQDYGDSWHLRRKPRSLNDRGPASAEFEILNSGRDR